MTAILFKAFVFVCAVALILAGSLLIGIVLAGLIKVGRHGLHLWRAVLAFIGGGALAWLGVAAAMYLDVLGRQ